LGCFCGCCLIPFCLDDLKVWNIFEDWIIYFNSVSF
jgi:hypothetical protein